MKNMKLIYGGIIIPIILASVFIGFVANDVIFDETKDLGSVMDTLIGKPSLPEETEQTEQTGIAHQIPINSGSLTTNNDPNEWTESQTYHTTVDYQNSIVQIGDYDYQVIPSTWTKWTSFYYNGFSDDSEYWTFEAGGVAVNAIYIDAYMQIYAGHSGTLHWEFLITGSDGGHKHVTDFETGTLSVTGDHIDGAGFVSVYLQALVIDSTGDITGTIKVFNYPDGDWEEVGQVDELYIDGPCIEVEIIIDYIYFEPDDLVSNIRSQRRAVGDSINEFKVLVDNPSSSTIITINKPIDQDFSSINPIANTYEVGNDLIINGTIDTTYEVCFTSKMEQYLAISDVSDRYFTSQGFEGSLGGWFNNGLDSATLNSTIVSEGVYSLRLRDADGSSDYLQFDMDISPGMIYISYDCYYESKPTVFRLNAYNGDDSPALLYPSSTEENRWIHNFHSLWMDSYVTWGDIFFQFAFVTSSGTVFIDNFKIWQVNHVIETIDYFQTVFSGTMINWDGYSNPIVPYHTVSMELRDRCDDLLIKDFWDITNVNGEFSYLWQGKLDQKEYEFRSWSYESYWNPSGAFEGEEETEEAWNFDSYGTEKTASIDSSTKMVGDYSSKGEGSGDPFLRSYAYWTDCDFSEVDYIAVWMKINTTTGISSGYPTFEINSGGGTSSSTRLTFTDSFSLTISWQLVELNLDENVGAGASFDITSVNKFCWLMNNNSNVGWSIWTDGLRLIQSSKSYFTPTLLSDSIYYYETNPNNEFDFSEETTESFTQSSPGGSITTTQGYLLTENDGSRSYQTIVKSSLSVDTSYYTHIIFRVWSNVSGSSITLRDSGSNQIGVVYSIPDNIWTQYVVNVGSDSDWTGIETYFDFVFSTDTSNKKSIKYDQIRLVHRDSNLESGCSSEFNENNYEDEWILGDTSKQTFISHNGYSEVLVSISGTYQRINLFNLNLEITEDTIFMVRAKSIVGIDYLRFAGVINGGNYWSDVTPVTIGEWVIYENTWFGQSGTLSQIWLYFYKTSWGTSTDPGDNILFDYIKIINPVPSNLYETDNSFLLANENLIEYITFTDSVYSGDYSTGEFIPKNITVGSHTLTYTAYFNYFENMVTIPSVWYSYDYNIDEPGIMKIIIHDQASNVILFDSFKVYIDSTRLYDNYLYFTDVSQTFNLTITDLFDNMLYQDTTEAFEQFKEIQLTLHSVKVQNVQDNPIWFRIERGSKYYSEWIFSFEVSEFRLEEADYTIHVYYSDVAGNFSVATNGTYVSYAYHIDLDTAIRITGTSIEDVFNNVVSLTQNLDDVNASLSNQIVSVNISIANVNTSISNQVVSVEIHLNNVNSSIGTQLISLESDLANVNSTIFSQTVQLLSDLANTNSTIFSQTVQCLSDIQNANATLYAQDILILNSLVNTNSTLYSQTVTLLDNLAELAGIYRVHFSCIDAAGIGLPWETVLLTVNDTRQFDQDIYVSNNTIFNSTAYDWFDVELWSDTYTITQKTEVNISIDLYDVIFFNNGSYTAYVEVWRNNKLGINVSIPEDQSIAIRLTSGLYDYRVYYFEENEQDTNTADPGIYSYSRKLIQTGNFRVSAAFPSKINTSTPKVIPPLLTRVKQGLTLDVILISIISGVIGLTAGYFVTNFFIRPSIGKVARDPAYVKPEDRDDLATKLYGKVSNTDSDPKKKKKRKWLW